MSDTRDSRAKDWLAEVLDKDIELELKGPTLSREIARSTIPEAPWYIVEGDDKKPARLNGIAHLLTLFSDVAVPHQDIQLPDRVFNPDYEPAVLPPELYAPPKY